MNFEDACFKSNPNFRFQEVISDSSEILSSTYQFDCYKNAKGEVILITPFFNTKDPVNQALKQDYHISLINLKNNEVVKTLEGHTDRITTVRYFQDPLTKKDYFISADKKYKIIVWDLNDYSIKLETEIKYEGFIYSCLLLFIEKKIYAVTSSLGANSITKVIEVNNKGASSFDIKDSKELNVYFLAYWYNQKEEVLDKRHVIIQCAKNNILMSEFPSNTTYNLIQTDKNYPYNTSCIVFKNNNEDLLAVASSYGHIYIIDLASKNIVKNIIFDNVHLYSFVFWNENYLLINDSQQKRIIVIGIKNDYKAISKVLCPEMNFERFIKKIEHPIYGESILSIGIDWRIKLFVNRNIIMRKVNA